MLWGCASGTGPPTVRVVGRIAEAREVTCDGLGLVTVWGNVENLGLYALVFRVGIGIVGDNICNSPDRGELPSGHGIANRLEVVGRAFHVWICQDNVNARRAARERRTSYLSLTRLCGAILCGRGGHQDRGEYEGRERRGMHFVMEGYFQRAGDFKTKNDMAIMWVCGGKKTRSGPGQAMLT